MGLRGPGALRKTALQETAPAALAAVVLPWKLEGLSRFQRVVLFLEFLPITKGKLAGTQMVLLPEQRLFIREVFGRVRKRKRVRRIAVQSEPRGNGKTSFLAAISLCFLLGPEAERRGEVYSAAIDRKQAGIMFNEMEAIILAVPEFASRTNIVRFHKMIEVLGGDGAGSTYEALSADARRGHGLAPTLWVYDELAQAKDRELLDNLMTAMGKRNEPLGVVISTQAASDDHPLSQLIDDGLRGGDETLYVQLHAAPIGADAFDEKTWRACNPAWGKFLDETDFRMQAERARRIPAFEPAFRNLRLNQRIDSNDENRIVTPAVWKLGAVDVSVKDGARCFGGLDLSGKHDLTALVLAFPNSDGTFDLLPFFWTPQGQIAARSPNEQALFREWVNDGHLIAVPGPVIEFEYVAAQIAALARRYKIEAIGYDRWRIEEFKHELGKLKATVNLEPFGQGYKDMAPAVENFAEMAMTARLHHGGHPVLNACVANAILTKPDDAGNQKFAKGKANAGSVVRIDGVVAAAMALQTAKRTEANAKPVPQFQMMFA